MSAVFAKEGYPLQLKWKTVVASATTAPISAPGDGVPGRERVIVTAATTLVGTVTVFDGDTSLLVHNAAHTGFPGSNVTVYEIGVHAQTTEGFNITTGSSVSCMAIGRF
jgi:hypothetical protein